MKKSKRSKKAKKIYDALRYRKKKLINLIEDLGKELKNIYGNLSKEPLSKLTKKDIEELYKKAVFDKDKYAKNKLLELGEEYKGGTQANFAKWVQTLQDDLQANIYGTNVSKLPLPVKRDLENFKTLMDGLTPEQKAEFLNSSSYYGARRYQKPVAESLTFLMQIVSEGKSYIVDNLIKYYKDNGLSIPDLKTLVKNKERYLKQLEKRNK